MIISTSYIGVVMDRSARCVRANRCVRPPWFMQIYLHSSRHRTVLLAARLCASQRGDPCRVDVYLDGRGYPGRDSCRRGPSTMTTGGSLWSIGEISRSLMAMMFSAAAGGRAFDQRDVIECTTDRFQRGRELWESPDRRDDWSCNWSRSPLLYWPFIVARGLAQFPAAHMSMQSAMKCFVNCVNVSPNRVSGCVISLNNIMAEVDAQLARDKTAASSVSDER